jgi:hypothetical protein
LLNWTIIVLNNVLPLDYGQESKENFWWDPSFDAFERG